MYTRIKVEVAKFISSASMGSKLPRTKGNFAEICNWGFDRCRLVHDIICCALSRKSVESYRGIWKTNQAAAALCDGFFILRSRKNKRRFTYEK